MIRCYTYVRKLINVLIFALLQTSQQLNTMHDTYVATNAIWYSFESIIARCCVGDMYANLKFTFGGS